MLQTSVEQMRAWQRPALFSYGFRPFFLFGAVWAALAMLIWLAAMTVAIDLPTRFDAVSWHAHEFLFGYLSAVLAGFLLTAVPNWTGRLPMVGWPLATLFALWVAGRVTVFFSTLLPAAAAPLVDLAFPMILGGVILREIVAGKNWRNLIVLALLAVFTLANGLFHLQSLKGGYAAQGVGLRLGLATAVIMIAVIGGRIIPSFTRNWLAQSGNPARPAPPMQRFDKLVLGASVLVLALWVVQPVERLTGIALVALGILHLARLTRWQGLHTRAEPLVWVLHVAYAFVPIGALALGAVQILGKASTVEAQHLWMAGAIGAMTLAVMTRAARGHTGKPLEADRLTVAIYVCLFGSVFARLFTSTWPATSYLSGVLWFAAFTGFVLSYGPLLLCAKPDSRA